MARIDLHPAFTGVSGAIGSLVLYTCRKKSYARTYVVPRNPDTPAQRSNRDLFRKAMKSWQSLADNEKAAYNRRAARLPMSGHNLYISRYMRTHSPTQAPARLQKGPGACARSSSAAAPVSFGRFSSVAAPSLPVYRVLSRPQARKCPPG